MFGGKMISHKTKLEFNKDFNESLVKKNFLISVLC